MEKIVKRSHQIKLIDYY